MYELVLLSLLGNIHISMKTSICLHVVMHSHGSEPVRSSTGKYLMTLGSSSAGRGCVCVCVELLRNLTEVLAP